MKQKKWIKEVYKACLEHDEEKLKQLMLEEFKKIFERKKQGKDFNPRWTVIR